MLVSKFLKKMNAGENACFALRMCGMHNRLINLGSNPVGGQFGHCNINFGYGAFTLKNYHYGYFK